MQIMKTAKQYTINFFSQSFTKVGRKQHYSVCPHSKYKTEQLVSIFHTWFGKRQKWIRLVDKPKLWSCPQLVWMISQLQLPCKLECTRRNAPSVFTPSFYCRQPSEDSAIWVALVALSLRFNVVQFMGLLFFLVSFLCLSNVSGIAPYMTNSTFRKITEILEPADNMSVQTGNPHSLSKSSWARFCHIQSWKMHITFKIKKLGASDGKQ